MKYLGGNKTLSEFRSYVQQKDFGSIPPNEIVIHHTWRPTKEQWKGRNSLEGIRDYYVSKGWAAGPHLFIAEDGIWLFTDMYDVGIHAGEGNATWKTPTGRIVKGYSGGWGAKLQSYSIGIEVVGDYDTDVWTGETKKNTLGAIKVLLETLGLEYEDISFHRDYSSKSCPGHAITKEWLIRELQGLASDGTPTANINTAEPSPWAVDGWEWQKKNSFDLTVHPRQEVTAEWVFAILKSYEDAKSSRKLKK